MWCVRQILEVFDEIWNDEYITRKIQRFEEDTRTSGAPYTTVCKWAKPLERARLSTAASKEYRQSLLRVDKQPNNRKKGAYPDMEREVYCRFKEKRARGRKVSARWVSSMARQVMKQTDAPWGALRCDCKLAATVEKAIPHQSLSAQVQRQE